MLTLEELVQNTYLDSPSDYRTTRREIDCSSILNIWNLSWWYHPEKVTKKVPPEIRNKVRCRLVGYGRNHRSAYNELIFEYLDETCDLWTETSRIVIGLFASVDTLEYSDGVVEWSEDNIWETQVVTPEVAAKLLADDVAYRLFERGSLFYNREIRRSSKRVGQITICKAYMPWFMFYRSSNAIPVPDFMHNPSLEK